MRLVGIPLIGALVAVAFCAGPAFADELQRGGNVTCKGPFSNKDTGLGVMARYKSASKIEEVAGLDGEPSTPSYCFQPILMSGWKWRIFPAVTVPAGCRRSI